MSDSVFPSAIQSPPENGWLLLFVQSGQELDVAEQLRAAGLKVLLPLFSGSEAAPGEPLFPRYLFVRHSTSLNWAQLRSTPGVRNVVNLGMAGSPYSICEDRWVRDVTRTLGQQLRNMNDGTQRTIQLLMACTAPPAR
jgi:transcription antitermination factor NusG